MNDLESQLRDAFRGHEGDAPAFDLSDARRIAGRTRRRQILNAAGAGIGALAVVVAITAALGGLVRADRIPADQLPPAPAGTAGIALPIEYPVGEELPDLGDTPGPLAAIWVSPPAGDGGPEVVGLVAETGMFGTLPFDLSLPDAAAPFATGIALSPDGRKVAYRSTTGQVVVRDLMSGESSSPLTGIETRDGFTWYSEAGLTKLPGHRDFGVFPLIGHVAGGTDADGWVWKPGEAPKLVDLEDYGDALGVGGAFLEPYGTRDVWVKTQGGGPRSCSPPTLDSASRPDDVQGLCDVLHFVSVRDPGGLPTSLYLLGHWNDPNDRNGTVVAVPSAWGYPEGEEVPDERRVVVTAGAPERVTFATELIGCPPPAWNDPTGSESPTAPLCARAQP